MKKMPDNFVARFFQRDMLLGLVLFFLAVTVSGCASTRQAVVTDGNHTRMRIDRVDGRVFHVSVPGPTGEMIPLRESIHVTGQLEGWMLIKED